MSNTKPRNESTQKPNLVQTQSSTSLDPKLNKAEQVRRDNDNVKNPHVGIYDVDMALKNFLTTGINPNVEIDGVLQSVPIYYASPERWKSAMNDGFFKDKNGKQILPVIIFTRNGISYNNEMVKTKIHNFTDDNQLFERKYTEKNKYTAFSVLNNQKPIKEYISVERPDYVDVDYEMMVWCEFTPQLNRVIEQFIYFSGRSYGERYKFVIKSDSISFETSNDFGADRIVKANVSLTVKAYIVPEFASTSRNSKKVYSVGKIRFGESVVLGGNTFLKKSGNE